MRYWILPLALAAMYAGVAEAAIEKRHECTGQYSIEADLVDLDGGWLILRTTAGRLIELPAAQLSRADRQQPPRGPVGQRDRAGGVQHDLSHPVLLGHRFDQLAAALA